MDASANVEIKNESCIAQQAQVLYLISIHLDKPVTALQIAVLQLVLPYFVLCATNTCWV